MDVKHHVTYLLPAGSSDVWLTDLPVDRRHSDVRLADLLVDLRQRLQQSAALWATRQRPQCRQGQQTGFQSCRTYHPRVTLALLAPEARGKNE